MATITHPGVQATTLSNDEVLRYSRHLIMPEVGMEGQLKLKAAKVLVVVLLAIQFVPVRSDRQQEHVHVPIGYTRWKCPRSN